MRHRKRAQKGKEHKRDAKGDTHIWAQKGTPTFARTAKGEAKGEDKPKGTPTFGDSVPARNGLLVDSPDHKASGLQ